MKPPRKKPDTVLFGPKPGTGVPPTAIPVSMFENPTFLKGVVIGMSDLIAHHEIRIRELEAQLEPVLWICYSCGAPNQVARVLWKQFGGIGYYCDVCHSAQHSEWLKQFDIP